MNPETFDQVSLPKALFGPAAAYLKENDLVEVEFHEGRAISAHFPPSVEAVVASTGAVMKGVGTPKEAVLENGARVLVPQWIKEGDRIRLEVESGKYLERVMEKK
jgi:elongation factor P